MYALALTFHVAGQLNGKPRDGCASQRCSWLLSTVDKSADLQNESQVHVVHLASQENSVRSGHPAHKPRWKQRACHGMLEGWKQQRHLSMHQTVLLWWGVQSWKLPMFRLCVVSVLPPALRLHRQTSGLGPCLLTGRAEVKCTPHRNQTAVAVGSLLRGRKQSDSRISRKMPACSIVTCAGLLWILRFIHLD